MSIFKAYDIRGIYPDDLADELAEKIGTAAAHMLAGRTIVVGRDMRVSSPAIAAAVIRGLTRAGADVVDIGQVTSPMVTFAVAQFAYDGGVMVTASHNPARYAGMKLCRKGAEPVSYDSGIDEIERRVRDDDLPAAPAPGSVTPRDVLPEYLDHLAQAAEGIHDLKLVIDAGNGMAGMLMPRLFERIDAQVVPLYFELDGTFPNHDANPLKPENLADLQERVVDEGADLGIAFDGDGDRVAFVDESGQAVACDITTALIAREVLRTQAGAAIIYDLRSSRAVREEIEACGGVPVISRVGHSYVKRTMRDRDAAFGGELSGHYYFRENFYCDSGAFTLLRVLSLLCREAKPFSQLVAPLQRYHSSGEVNSEVADKDACIEDLARAYACGNAYRLDGLTVDFADWWFNVRPSNTEPVLRLVVEATTRERMETMRDTILARIRRPFAVRRILVPTDFSAFAAQALPYAAAMAEDTGAELHILHVLPTPEMIVQLEAMAPITDMAFIDDLETGAHEQLGKVVPDELRPRVHVVPAIRTGVAFLEIVRYAQEERIDLIVLTTHGRTGLRHALFGSVAEKVVRRALCPVLSIHPRGHEFALP